MLLSNLCEQNICIAALTCVRTAPYIAVSKSPPYFPTCIDREVRNHEICVVY